MDTVAKMKIMYARYNCAYPDGSEKVLQLVSGNAFSSHVKHYIITQMQLSSLPSKARSPCLTWRTLLKRMTCCMLRLSNLRPTIRMHLVVCKCVQSVPLLLGLNHDRDNASMSGQGCGGGRSYGGHGRWGGFQESRPAASGDFSSGPAGIHTISLCGNAGRNSHVQLPTSATTMATALAAVAAQRTVRSAMAAQRNLRSRPYNAEPDVVRLLRRRLQRTHRLLLVQLNLTATELGLPRSGVECLSSSNVQMSWGGMLEIAGEPAFRDACKPMQAYISRNPAHVHTISAHIPVEGVEPAVEPKAAHEFAPEPVTDAPKADVQKKPASYATVLSAKPKPTVPAAPVGNVVNAVLSAASVVQG